MIGERIKKARLNKNITQERLAAMLYITPQAVSKWELGTAVPDTCTLVPLADILGVSVDYLLREPAEKDKLVFNTLLETSIDDTPKGKIVAHGKIKNISPYTFESVEYKARFLSRDGDIVDVKNSSIGTLAPMEAKVISVFTPDMDNVDRIEIEITEVTVL